MYTSLANERVLSDTTVSSSATDMDQAADGSGWKVLRVPVVKQILLSVDVVILKGIIVAAIVVMTSQYRVVLDLYEVSNFTFIVFCVFLQCLSCVRLFLFF